MNRRHAAVIAVAIGIAALFGAVAAVRTANPGAARGGAAQTAKIGVRHRSPGPAERPGRHVLSAPAHAPAARHAEAPSKTMYGRPAPIIVHLHPHGGEGDGGGAGSDG